MKNIMITTAIAAMLALPAAAQTAPPTPAGDGIFLDTGVDQALYADDLIGKNIYTSETEVDTSAQHVEISQDWDAIGEVNDIVLNRSGQVQAVLVDVGGFLGLGAKLVAVSMDSLRVVPDADAPDDYFLVFTASRAGLEAAPEYKRPETTVGAMTPGAGTTGSTAATGAAGAPAWWVDPTEGYERVEPAGLTADELKGVNLYDANNADVGSVSDVVLSADGKIERVIVDIGGFLGIGAKPVALPFAEIDFHKQVDGDTYRAYVSMTKEQLEALPRYDS